MKSMLSATTLSLIVVASISQVACASHHHAVHAPSIDERQYDQQLRIEQGMRSGELSREETQTLRAEQRAIRREERVYRADGVLRPWERRELRRELDEASQNIYEEKRDAERRVPWY